MTCMSNKARAAWNFIKHSRSQKYEQIPPDIEIDQSAQPNSRHGIIIEIDETAPPDVIIQIDQSAPPILPPEIIIEIMLRLPVKTLLRSQLVCKYWRALISNDDYFIEKHMDRWADRDVEFWYSARIDPSPSCRVKPGYDSFTCLYGCDGLLLLKNNTSLKHCLWNPATHRILELPNPHDDSLGPTLSFVPATKNYKIVSFYEDNKESGTGELGCEVFTPGQSNNVWRRLKFPEIMNLSEMERNEGLFSVISIGGAVHCVLCTIGFGQETNVDIVSLELETETFTVNHFPKLLGPLVDWKIYWGANWDGKLGIVDVVGQNLEVMELEDYKKQRWSEKKKITHLPFLKAGNVNLVYPLFLSKGKLFIGLEDEKMLMYTIATGKQTDTIISNRFVTGNINTLYYPTLINFEGMVPDTKLERLRAHSRLQIQSISRKRG